jgi:hypothetical protein
MSMNDEDKREYLKTNFIKPLSDNISGFVENDIVTENFASMINFDINTEDQYEDSPFVEDDIYVKNLIETMKSRNPHLKYDEEKESSIDTRFLKIQKLDKLEVLLEENVIYINLE